MARTASPFSSRTTPNPPVDPTAGVDDVVERLTRLDGTGHWVVSCYLKLEPRDRGHRKYLIKLKNRIRSRADWLASQHLGRAERDMVGRDLERVREYLEDPIQLPAGRGIALFASEALDLMAAIPLPQVFRSRLGVDRTPLIGELVAVGEEFGVVLCVVYDRTSARFFRVTAFQAEELSSIPAFDTTRTSRFHGISVSAGPGRGMAAPGEYGHNLRIQEEKHRHYATIAQGLLELSRTGGVRGVVLAGIGVDAEAVLPHLHPYVRGMVLGSVRLNPKSATAAEVRNAVFEVRRESEREAEERLVRELQENVGTGWAVNGIEPTLQALAFGQVRTLLIRPNAAHPGFRCESWNRLCIDSQACDGPAVPVEDVIDEALEDALRERSHVDVVETADLAANIDGLAGLLRFKL